MSNRGPSAYQPTALPLGQTGSPINTLYTYKYGYNNVRQLGLVKDREGNISDTRNQTLHRGIVSLKMISLPISMTPKTTKQKHRNETRTPARVQPIKKLACTL